MGRAAQNILTPCAGKLNAARAEAASRARRVRRQGPFGFRRRHQLHFSGRRFAKVTEILMGELNEKRWAVLSERGCESPGLTYEEAVQLVRRLAKERVSGLCVITDEAARRLPQVKAAPNAQTSPLPD